MNPLRIAKYASLLVILTLLYGTVYLAVQQNYRQSADDPQIQVAEDAVPLLDQGAVPLWGSNELDLSRTLSSFVAVYSASGTPVEASGLLDGKVPSIPAGVLAYAKAHGEDRVTWQVTDASSTALRFAAVAVPYKNGYVVAARSLREIEARENALLYQVGIPWLVSVLIVLAYGFFAFRYKKN